MEKIISHIKLIVEIDEKVKDWFYEINSDNYLENSHHDSNFLLKTLKIEGDVLNKEFLKTSREQIKKQFGTIIPEEDVYNYPRIKIIDSYEGCWVIEAVIWHIIPAAIAIKVTSEIPQIFDGIKDLERRIRSQYERIIEKLVRSKINAISKVDIPKEYEKVIGVSLDIQNVINEGIEKPKPIEKELKLNAYLKIISGFTVLLILILFFFWFNNIETVSPSANLETRIETLEKSVGDLNKKVNQLEEINSSHLDVIKAANETIEQLKTQNEQLIK